MRFLNLKEQCLKLNDPQINNLTRSIELNRGKSFTLPKKFKVNRLHELNKRRSVTSSNKIEGIEIGASREEPIIFDKVKAETQAEFLLGGYNKALGLIYETYKYQSLTEGFIKDLHYKLYEGYNPEFGGKYKTEQNYIREHDKNGNLIRTVFIPVKPSEVDDYMGNLVFQFNSLINDPSINKLVLITAFTLDFLCIHPFFDGNGRISRLLTTFLLTKYGYDIDSFYSTSYVMLNSINDYYSSLEASSNRWKDGTNDYSFFVHYMLQVISEAYIKLDYIVSVNSSEGKAKDKVLRVINDSPTKITKSDIEELLVNYSRTSIELALGELLKEDKVIILNKGRYSRYFRK